MLLRTSFAAALIAVMAVPAIAGKTLGEPIFSGTAAPILVRIMAPAVASCPSRGCANRR